MNGRGFGGIRIEDDVLRHGPGPRDAHREIPKSIDEVEAAVRAGA
jgi:hypothetical protein